MTQSTATGNRIHILRIQTVPGLKFNSSNQFPTNSLRTEPSFFCSYQHLDRFSSDEMTNANERKWNHPLEEIGENKRKQIWFCACVCVSSWICDLIIVNSFYFSYLQRSDVVIEKSAFKLIYIGRLNLLRTFQCRFWLGRSSQWTEIPLHRLQL